MREKRAFHPSTGNIYPIKNINGVIERDEQINIVLDTVPPTSIEADVTSVSRPFAGLVFAKIIFSALEDHLQEEIVKAKINVVDIDNPAGKLTVEHVNEQLS